MIQRVMRPYSLLSQVFNSTTSKEKIWDILTRIMDIYNHEAVYISPIAATTTSSSSVQPSGGQTNSYIPRV